MTQAYFLILLLAAAYYDKYVVIVSGAATMLGNLIFLFVFPERFSYYNSAAAWAIIGSEFIASTLIAVLIAQNTFKLFNNVEAKEKETNKLIQILGGLIENIKQVVSSLTSTCKIMSESLSQFNQSSQEIAKSTQEIALGSSEQNGEIDRSLNKIMIKGEKDIKGDITLVGYSLGGSIALELALDKMPDVSNIVMLSSSAKWVLPGVVTQIVSDRQTAESLMLSEFTPASTQESIDYLKNNFDKIIAPDSVRVADMTAAMNFDRVADLKNLSVPVLLMVGEEIKINLHYFRIRHK